MTKRGILTVSFGTACLNSLDLEIGAVERAVCACFPEYEVRRAFSSEIVIRKLKDRYGMQTDSLNEALQRAALDGFQSLIVQPLYLADGYEYTKLKNTLKEYRNLFEHVALGSPLLACDEDVRAAARAVAQRTAEYDDGKTAVCFMGHGSAAREESVYEKLRFCLSEEGYENYYIGTMKAVPSFDDMRKRLREHGGYRKIVLQPFLVTAGSHARTDMAGVNENSWKNMLEREGYDVRCLLEGLGRIPAIQRMYVSHVKKAAQAGKAAGQQALNMR